MTDVFETRGPHQTEQVAESIGLALDAYMVLLLHGDLGAGKTTFVRGLVRGLRGDPDQVASPTFVFLRCYSARLPIHHYDLYRATDLTACWEIGLIEHLDEPGVHVVEWAELLEPLGLLPRLEITFSSPGEDVRILTINPFRQPTAHPNPHPVDKRRIDR